jgi:pimeloyl-ACP methyl ester carboxylesterase
VSRPTTIETDGIRLSGLVAHPDAATPRAVIVALPGMSMRAGYYDGPVDPEGSLLARGAAEGFTVLALDRPGYGDSVDAPEELLALDRQVQVLHDTFDAFAASHAIGAGFFLAAHSFGARLALATAVAPRGDRFLGLDCASWGLHQDFDHMAPEPAERDHDQGPQWGPEHLYPAGTFEPGRLPLGRVPAAERVALASLSGWPELLRRIGPDVRVPLRFTYGSDERLWKHDDASLAELRSLFPASPSVSTEVIHGAGHNITLSLVAPEFHRRVVAFAEECVARAAC